VWKASLMEEALLDTLLTSKNGVGSPGSGGQGSIACCQPGPGRMLGRPLRPLPRARESQGRLEGVLASVGEDTQGQARGT
jgi:hypothetical protein